MKLPLFILLLTLSSLSQAQGGYVGLNATLIDTDLTDHQGTTLTAGIAFNEFLSVEGRTLISSSTETYDGVALDIDNLYGVYAILSVPVGDSIYPYIMLGRTKGEVTASYRGYSASGSDSGNSYGVGVRVDLREAWKFTVEYNQLLDEVKSINAGINYVF